MGVGLPNLLSFGGTAKLTRYLGGGINIGLIPTVKISYYGEATLSYQEYDIYGRLYPFGGMFFLGAGVGYETVKGKIKTTLDPSTFGIPGLPTADILSEASVKTMVLTPQIGIFHTWGSGFSLGLDVGAQVPIAPSKVNITTTLPSQANDPLIKAQADQYVADNEQKVRDSLEKIGRTIIPTINFRIGWLL